eukprot:21216-Chlamydomonas_euryale.AAC.12
MLVGIATPATLASFQVAFLISANGNGMKYVCCIDMYVQSCMTAALQRMQPGHGCKVYLVQRPLARQDSGHDQVTHANDPVSRLTSM